MHYIVCNHIDISDSALEEKKCEETTLQWAIDPARLNPRKQNSHDMSFKKVSKHRHYVGNRIQTYEKCNKNKRIQTTT